MTPRSESRYLMYPTYRDGSFQIVSIYERQLASRCDNRQNLCHASFSQKLSAKQEGFVSPRLGHSFRDATL